MTQPIKNQDNENNLTPIIQFQMIELGDIKASFDERTLSNQPFTANQAFAYLKYKSNQRKTYQTFTKGGCTVTLQLGQFVTTYKQLEYTFNWGKGKVRYQMSKWIKNGLISKLELRNDHHRSVGLLITCNSLIKFREQVEKQRQETEKNYKKIPQNLNTIKSRFNQQIIDSSTPKSIKGNTYENNKENPIKNSLRFEANKKLYEFNSKILEEKRKQEEELLILRNALKKEKTRNNQLKSMKRFEVKGQVKSDKVKFDWSFQDTQEFKMICDKLKTFGFEQYTINKIWWKHSGDITRLIDYIDYTQMKYEQGKVADRKKFLYHALQASYDIGELYKLRLEQQTYEEKARIADEKRNLEIKIRELEIQKRGERERENQQQLAMVRAWIKSNQENPVFEQVLGQLEQENQFMITRLSLNARKHGFRNAFEFIRSDKIGEMDLGLSGVLSAVMEIR